MLTDLHYILVGGAIALVTIVSTLGWMLSSVDALFGGSNYSKVAREIGAAKIESNLYEVKMDGLSVSFGESISSYRIKSIREYFSVATAHTQAGYLGIYDRPAGRGNYCGI